MKYLVIVALALVSGRRLIDVPMSILGLGRSDHRIVLAYWGGRKRG